MTPTQFEYIIENLYRLQDRMQTDKNYTVSSSNLTWNSRDIDMWIGYARRKNDQVNWRLVMEITNSIWLQVKP